MWKRVKTPCWSGTTSTGNDKIDRDEVLNGIEQFFLTPPIGSVISREEVLDLIELFFEGLGS